MILLLKLSLLGVGGLLLWRYTRIVRRLTTAWAQYEGYCAHEHSLYDVEKAQWRLRWVQTLYLELVILIGYTLL